MTRKSLIAKIRKGNRINVVCGYAQGDVWILRPQSDDDAQNEWTAENTVTGESHRFAELRHATAVLHKKHQVRKWAVL